MLEEDAVFGVFGIFDCIGKEVELRMLYFIVHVYSKMQYGEVY